MTTTVSTRTIGAGRAGTHDRLFYTGIAGAMALTVFLGFGSTYYFRVLSGTPVTFSGGSLTPTVHAHALLFTAWVLLFIAQTSLIAARRVTVHRRLGYASVALAAGMVVVGLKTAIEAAARGSAPPGVDSLTFLAVPVFDVILFTGFYAAAMMRRRDREAHKRLMLLAYISIVTAAVARLPGLLPLGPLVFFGLSFQFAIAGIIYDRISRGRVHRVYVWGASIIALSVPLRLGVSGTPAWHSFAAWLVS